MITNLDFYDNLIDYLKKNGHRDVINSISSKLFASRPFFRELENKKDLIGVELGVQFGVNAYRILETLDMEILYLIDYFPNSKVAEFCLKVLEEFNDKIKYIAEKSITAINKIPDNLDFIYIDGDHKYYGVKLDIELYYPKVKSGGLFGGHDYVSREKGLISAVTEFGKTFDYKIHHNNWDWWIYKR